jgi:TetR/AcrR family transcriptional repressor of mexJK operon
MTVEPTPRASAKREQIRAAAQQLFLRHGFEATTMDAITATAGISKQTLYRYYPGKEALFADILDALTLRRGQEVAWPPPEALHIASHADLVAALTWLAHDIINDTMHPALIALLRVLIAEAPRFPHLKDLFHATVSGPGFAAVSGLLEQARAAGVVVVPDTEAAARLFLGALLTYSMVDGFFAADAPQPPPEGEVAAIVRLFVRAVT